MKTFRLGRNRPIVRAPSLRLGNYLLRTVTPPPPSRSDWAAPAIHGLEDVLGNDEYGDCVFAGALHVDDVFRADSKSGLPFGNRAQALSLYSAVTGFNPNDPSTDCGGDLQTMLAWWRDKGLFGDGSAKCAGWVSVNAADETEVKTAIWLFGNIYIAIELPEKWVSPFPRGTGWTWDVAGDPNPSNGHCIMAFGYNATGVFVDTWGEFGTVTYAALAKYAVSASGGECYSVLSPEWIDKATGESPSGFNMAALTADLAAFA